MDVNNSLTILGLLEMLDDFRIHYYSFSDFCHFPPVHSFCCTHRVFH